MSTIHFLPPRGQPTNPTLHLMPFHIEHNGPCPLSTYFLVRPASDLPSASASTFASTSAPTSVSPSTSLPDKTETQSPGNPSLKNRFTSSFRGRALKGVQVPLPEGYTGVLLRSSAPAPAPAARVRRPSPVKRRSRKRAASPIPVETDGDGDAGERQAEDQREKKDLRIEGCFEGFVLWNADVDVDEEDEYLRTLGEWQRLAALIHDTHLGGDA
ncbi:hypothetical protein DACRYDRAFT_105926 [Dacryopinax primogenitus]|uniref:Uncharacterized protein n=1 Tax=Dacryopinax primogenitus (strain DJM 731) TaxID=1858805 RepID=M5G0J7_DACPD|nr:uncharacterized protein DACRYDRAFT_105926 [Dacryopinax primogenitus]EJU03771.1 hypothetical protein DACRYDRAFT_105926 [Dacryopinax primogenitus]